MWRSTRFILRGSCEGPFCSVRVIFRPTAPYQPEKADQRYAFGSVRVRWDCLHCSWVLCFSPASQDISQPPHKWSSTRSWVISCWPGRLWIIFCKRQLQNRWTGCSPATTWLTQCISHLGSLLLRGKVLSYHLVIIVSLGVWNGMGGRKGILKPLLILQHIKCCQHMLWQSKKSISPASLLG